MHFSAKNRVKLEMTWIEHMADQVPNTQFYKILDILTMIKSLANEKGQPHSCRIEPPFFMHKFLQFRGGCAWQLTLKPYFFSQFPVFFTLQMHKMTFRFSTTHFLYLCKEFIFFFFFGEKG